MAQLLDSTIFESTRTWREQRFLVTCRSVLWRLLLALTVYLTPQPALATGGRNAGESQSPQYLPDRVIVKFATGGVGGPQRGLFKAYTTPAKVADLLARFGAVETEQLFPPRPRFLQKASAPVDLSAIYEFRFNQPVNVAKLVQLLRQQPDVVYAEPRYLHRIYYDPNDPSISSQTYLTVIKAREAWDITQGDPDVVIGIVDTGVDWQHNDLQANIWQNSDEIPNNGSDDDNNGKVDDVRGWDFGGLGNPDNSATPDNDPREDKADHGTAVAGIASAATNNGLGVAGIGFKCKIMPVKTSQDNVRDGSTALIAYGYDGIAYAAENGAHIINCSWGGGGFSQFGQDVIDYATQLGALVVAAAGNESNSSLSYPAAYRNVLSVAATDNNDIRAGFSNYGYWVDVSAPGDRLYTTWQVPANSYNPFFRGTSASAPVISGVAALGKSVHKDWTPGAIAEQIRLAADNIDSQNPGYNRQLGFGRVNAQRAVMSTFKTPAVRLAGYTLRETVGDGDGIFEANEEVAVSIRLTNFLEPVSNLSVTLTENSAFVNMISSTLNAGTIGRGDTVAVAGTFGFRIAPNAPAGHVVTFYVDFSAANYNDWQGFTAVIRPLYGDLSAGNVTTTLTSIGALGFQDDYIGSIGGNGSGQIGRGFEFPIGSENALFHGGLIIGTASSHVSDVAYGNADGSFSTRRYDFVTSSGGELNIQPGKKATVEATSRFNDSVAEAPIGLTIDQKAYAWANAPWNDFVILEYTIRNTTAQAISNVYAGFYLDWDIIDPEANFAGWDSANQLGYEWADGSAYYGITAVSPAQATSYRAVNNQEYDGTDAAKYQYMSEGFQLVRSDAVGDWSQLLSFGPYNLPAGQSVTVAFAVLGGTDLNDLKANAQAARSVYLTTEVDDSQIDPVPLQFALAQSTPNPFAMRTAPSTEIRYSLAETGPVTLRIFNVLGQEVAVLVRGVQNPGSYAVQWNGLDRRGVAVPSGVYFYQLKTPGFTATRKLIVVE
ncbi:S8 family peptidase [candidate division KSB1 bacterium]|nr:S8 family peptidase [candidate division KSB1 bacterium]